MTIAFVYVVPSKWQGLIIERPNPEGNGCSFHPPAVSSIAFVLHLLCMSSMEGRFPGLPAGLLS